MPVKVTYQFIKPSPMKVDFKVNGLPAGQQVQIQLSNGQMNHTINATKDGFYEVSIFQDKQVWQVTSSFMKGYRMIFSPNSFTAEISLIMITANTSKVTRPKFITGYWQNWKGALPGMEGSGSISESGYYKPSFAPYTHVVYAFLTLSSRPNPDNPQNEAWDGRAIYETMTLAPILTVMNDKTFSYAWQADKIKAMIKACNQQGKKFMWGIGGWSDLQQTLKPDQIDSFVAMCVDLLKQYGDGIDFDWEHLSQLAEGGPNPNALQQIATIS